MVENDELRFMYHCTLFCCKKNTKNKSLYLQLFSSNLYIKYYLAIYIFVSNKSLYLQLFSSNLYIKYYLAIYIFVNKNESLYLQLFLSNLYIKYYRVIIQVQSFIIKCLSFHRVSFVQGYRLCIEKLCT